MPEMREEHGAWCLSMQRSDRPLYLDGTTWAWKPPAPPATARPRLSGGMGCSKRANHRQQQQQQQPTKPPATACLGVAVDAGRDLLAGNQRRQLLLQPAATKVITLDHQHQVWKGSLKTIVPLAGTQFLDGDILFSHTRLPTGAHLAVVLKKAAMALRSRAEKGVAYCISALLRTACGKGQGSKALQSMSKLF